MSHELRTPLNAILGWADMLRAGALRGPAGAIARSDAIYDSAQRQAQLIDELLDVSRIMSGKLRLERRRRRLGDVVCGALEIVQPAADAKRIHVDGRRSTGALGAICGDSARLQQVVWNLLPTRSSSRPRAARCGSASAARSRPVEIARADSGQGIPRDFLPSVFEPFRQADGSTTRRHGGLGLGLAIVKQLVEAHGGTIAADSAGEGRGATFTVRLPIVARLRDAVEAAAPSAPRRRSRASNEAVARWTVCRSWSSTTTRRAARLSGGVSRGAARDGA